jgi:hypothetical protein
MMSGSGSSTDVGGSHIGLAVTIIFPVVIASLSGPRRTLAIAACFTSWFVLVLTVVRQLLPVKPALYHSAAMK